MACCALFALLIGYLAGARFRIAAVLLIELAAMPVAVGLALCSWLQAGDALLGFLLFSVMVQAGYGLAMIRSLPFRLVAQRRPAKA